MAKIIKKIYLKIMKKKGFVPHTAQALWKDFVEDIKNRNTNFSQKIWCWSKGFFSDKIEYYGLNKNNYQEYVPDMQYYKLYPINNAFSRWVNDKLTLKYVLQPYNKYLPEYYYVIKNGKLQKVFDCTEDYEEDIKSLIELLTKKKNLAVKLIDGEKGEGFYKLEKRNEKIYVNEEDLSKEQFGNWIENLNNYMVTEYLKGNSQIQKIYKKSLNTIRIMYINNENDFYIAKAFIRIGNKQSGIVDNVSQGGYFSFIDTDTGNYKNAYKLENGKLKKIIEHPDSKEKIEGNIPFWKDIKEKICEIGKYLFELEYLGFDIAVTEKGFKIIEINSFQGIRCFQIEKPLLKKGEKTREYFIKKIGEMK